MLKIEAMTRKHFDGVMKIQAKYHSDVDPEFQTATPSISYLDEEKLVSRLNDNKNSDTAYVFLDKYNTDKVKGYYFVQKLKERKCYWIKRFEIMNDADYTLCLKMIEHKIADEYSVREVRIRIQETMLSEQLAAKNLGYKCVKVEDDEDESLTYYIFTKKVNNE